MAHYQTVAVDFDGTISEYTKWQGLGRFGPVLPGCKNELQKLHKAGWTIIINTTRGDDIEQVKDFLLSNGVPFDHINENAPNAPANVSKAKVLASVYIDDRAITFDGSWNGMAEKVLNFTPHYLVDLPAENIDSAGASDLATYAKLADTLPPYTSFCKDFSLYDAYMPELAAFLSSSFVVPSQVANVREVLKSLAEQSEWAVREEAYRVFESKNNQRGGLWKDVGLVGALVEIHAKLARLRQNCTDHDSKIDLFNYAMIGMMCCDGKFIKPSVGGDKPKVMITGATGSLGEMLCQVFSLNGFGVFKAPQAKELGQVITWLDTCGDPQIDMFVNNHGTNHLNWIGQLEPEDYSVLDVNLKIPLFWVDQLIKKKFFTDNPRILNICSQTYRVPQRCTAAYCASKAGLAHLTKVMARELAGKGFVVNALAPGKIEDTKMSAITDEQVNKLRGWEVAKADTYAKSNIPMGRYTSREEVALAAISILHLPPYINGAVIDMTGGQ